MLIKKGTSKENTAISAKEEKASEKAKSFDLK